MVELLPCDGLLVALVNKARAMVQGVCTPSCLSCESPLSSRLMSEFDQLLLFASPVGCGFCELPWIIGRARLVAESVKRSSLVPRKTAPCWNTSLTSMLSNVLTLLPLT